MRPERIGILRCALAAVLFGATTPLAARIADEASAPMLGGLLYLGAAVAVAPIAHRRPPTPLAVRRGAPRLALAVLAGGLLGPLLLAAGLARTPGATASLLLNFELVATTVLAAVVFREHLGRRIVTGTVLVTAAGVALASSGTPDLRLGALLVVGACLCWALDNCVTAELDAIAPEHITLAKGVIAGGTNLALGLVVGGSVPAAGTVGAALAIGALGYGASITLWVSGARSLGAARGQLVFASAPFVGAVVAWAALGEQVRPVELVALLLAVAGVLTVVGSGHDHEHEHETVEHDHEHSHTDDHHDHEHDDAQPVARHSHHHMHASVVHAHPHVPDVHHRHEHPRRRAARRAASRTTSSGTGRRTRR